MGCGSSKSSPPVVLQRPPTRSQDKKRVAAAIWATNKGRLDDGYVYTTFDEEGDNDVEGYDQGSFGLMIKSVSFRTEHKDEAEEQRPIVQPGELYTDTDFPLKTAVVKKSSNVEWKRPGEFLSKPVLFHGNTTRFDIKQGEVGNCWLMSILCTIADNTDMVNQVVSRDAYKIEDPEAYDGVFHARFFLFGKWKDIYIDDYIPVLYGKTPFGAESTTKKDEVWVSLLEKAYARFFGSYDALDGRQQSADAYLQLTGGIGEILNVDKSGVQGDHLFRRISNALKSGCQATCSIPEKCDKLQGLVGKHAYSLVGTAEIKNTKLLRVRNPWGRIEWKGAWSKGSPQFKAIQSSGETVPRQDCGEFFICLEDFVRCFSNVTICSLTPDIDCNGKLHPMNFILNIFGEWTEEKMGGFREHINNPRFLFTVTKEGMLDDGTVPLFIQMIQHTEERGKDISAFKCNLFRITADMVRPTGRTIVAEVQGDLSSGYTRTLQSLHRHKLKPGRYMAIPSTLDGNIQNPFLLRIFTPAPLRNCKEVGMDSNILSCNNEDFLSEDGKAYELNSIQNIFGEWTDEKMGGFGELFTNPRFSFTVTKEGMLDDGTVPLLLQIMVQDSEKGKAEIVPIKVDVFKITDDMVRPTGKTTVVEIQGDRSRNYTRSLQSSYRHKLKPGSYMAIPSTHSGNVRRAFLLRMSTLAPLQNCKEVGMDSNILSCNNEDFLSEDGKAYELNSIQNIFGEWTDEKMGGFGELFTNPRFSFTVTKEGMLDDGTVPLLLQIMVQDSEKGKAEIVPIRVDVFKITDDMVRPTGKTTVVEIQGDRSRNYTRSLQSSYRHKLKPGSYMAIPSTHSGNVRRAFLLRMSTLAPLQNCKELGMDTNHMTRENRDSLIHNVNQHELTFDKIMFGAFVSGLNAGGHVGCRDTYSTNPQYLISIPDTGKDVPLVVNIMQVQKGSRYPLCFRLFPLVNGIYPPLAIDYLHRIYNCSLKDIGGNKNKNVNSWSIDVCYLLPAGSYVALVNIYYPHTDKEFAIEFKSNTNIGIE